VNLDKGYDIVDSATRIAAKHGVTVAQVSLGWVLKQPAVTSVIIGARNTSQLKDNLASVDLKLDETDLKDLDEVSRLAPEYPAWMAFADDRKPGQVRDWSKLLVSEKK
jgi:aryl-alcohol dehydrogenase-like predicted oxidoreductase